jgi:hypothetical protein
MGPFAPVWEPSAFSSPQGYDFPKPVKTPSQTIESSIFISFSPLFWFLFWFERGFHPNPDDMTQTD